MASVVLMYHDIYRSDVSESGFQNRTALKYKVSADNFENQVNTIDEYLRKHKLPRSFVEFTFDDGGVSFITAAAPILEKYGFRGTFFISTGYIGSNGFLDADQIRELQNRGHRIGSHSHSHPERMSALSRQQLADEWNVSQMMLGEVLGFAPNVASIPNGYKAKNVLEAMVDAGISEIHTSEPSTRTGHFRGASIKGRYAVTADDAADTVLALLSSPALRYRKAMRQKMLDIVKTLLGKSYLTIRKRLTI